MSNAKPGLLARLTGKAPRPRDRLLPLYEAIVGVARDPVWYRDGAVPDTVDGRFDMVTAVTAVVLVRMEALDEPAAKGDSVLLTEVFIEDMDHSLHQLGIGDYSVGKHVGRMVGALGGRLAAFRIASQQADFGAAVRRNIFHETPPSEAALADVAHRLARFDRALRALDLTGLVGARLPRP